MEEQRTYSYPVQVQVGALPLDPVHLAELQKILEESLLLEPALKSVAVSDPLPGQEMETAWVQVTETWTGPLESAIRTVVVEPLSHQSTPATAGPADPQTAQSPN